MSAINHQRYTATIVDGGMTVDFIDPNIIGRSIDRIFVPTSFSGTTLSIEERDPEGDNTWYPVTLIDGTQASWTVSGGSRIAVNVAFFPRTFETRFVSDVEQDGDCILVVYICNLL